MAQVPQAMTSLCLQDKVIVVTGGNSGIGKAIVETVGGLGAKVVIDYRSHPERTEELIEEIGELGGQAIGVQADVSKLPFREQFFNIIFSGGVLHHTGDAEGAFAALCRHLKPGGIIGIYIYCMKPFLRELADKEIRAITTEMSFEECLEFSEKITQLGKALRKFKDPLLVEDDIPLLGIKKGEYGLQKFIYDHFLKCFFSDELGYDISVLTNVDWYHPKHASHHTREEVAGWFEENRIADPQFIQPEGWEFSGYFVSGRKAH